MSLSTTNRFLNATLIMQLEHEPANFSWQKSISFSLNWQLSERTKHRNEREAIKCRFRGQRNKHRMLMISISTFPPTSKQANRTPFSSPQHFLPSWQRTTLSTSPRTVDAGDVIDSFQDDETTLNLTLNVSKKKRQIDRSLRFKKK